MDCDSFARGGVKLASASRLLFCLYMLVVFPYVKSKRDPGFASGLAHMLEGAASGIQADRASSGVSESFCYCRLAFVLFCFFRVNYFACFLLFV